MREQHFPISIPFMDTMLPIMLPSSPIFPPKRHTKMSYRTQNKLAKKRKHFKNREK
jgi:hypothetical protein